MPEGQVQINLGLVGVGLVLAPFVFVAVGFISRNTDARNGCCSRWVLLIVLGLGLLAPVLGATAAFGAGATVCLNPPSVRSVYKWRWWPTGLTVVYTFFCSSLLLRQACLSGGLLPLMMVGFADGSASWTHHGTRQPVRLVAAARVGAAIVAQCRSTDDPSPMGARCRSPAE